MEFHDPKMMTVSHVVDDDEEEAGTPLPGFRFHPTDEELVSFYLKRKIDKKPFSIEIIKQIDIYKYHPWDLAKTGSVGDKEWYFYCKRGRKYRNSVRPNRVTGTGGFWKATGIDRPIYDSNVVVNGSKLTQPSDYHCIVGLKKSLVYYRGSAGKGTKTDWMMHEFRLPSQPLPDAISQLPQAEVWTLCRIFKRSRKYSPDCRDFSSKRVSNTNNTSECNNERYISFGNLASSHGQHHHDHEFGNRGFKLVRQETDEQMKLSYSYNTNMKGTSIDHQDNPSNLSSPLNTSPSVYDLEQGGDGGSYWEDLSSVVEFAIGEMYNQNY